MNPYSRGSYSNQTVQSMVNGCSPKDLGEPSPMGKVLFAGEATSENLFSTMPGAIDSGIREAKRILDTLGQA